MITYDTVSEAVNGLKSRGFTLDFNLEENCLVCNNSRLKAHEFEIEEVHRFEGNTDPSDEAVVYGIESTDKQLRGVLVTGYGISAEGMSAEIISKLKINN